MSAAFDYVRVDSVAEATKRLGASAEDAAVLAGGTDLLVELRNRTRSPSLLVDVKRIPELRRLEGDDRQGLLIGAAVPLNTVAEDGRLQRSYRALAEAAASIGTYQIRSRATVAGNLANASPAADTAPPLCVLGAELEIAGPTATRSLPVGELFVGVKRTALRPGELITAVRLPPAAAGLRSAFVKQQRIRGHDLAIVNVAGAIDRASGRLRVAIGSCAPTPVVLPTLEHPMQGEVDVDVLAREINELAQAAVAPISDLRGSAAYRRRLIPVLLRRLLGRLFAEEEGADATD